MFFQHYYSLPAAFLTVFSTVSILNAYCSAGLTSWTIIFRHPAFFGGKTAMFYRVCLVAVWVLVVVFMGYAVFWILVKNLNYSLVEGGRSYNFLELSPYYMVSVTICMLFIRKAKHLVLATSKRYDSSASASESEEVFLPNRIEDIEGYINKKENSIWMIAIRKIWYSAPSFLCLIYEPAYRHRSLFYRGLTSARP